VPISVVTTNVFPGRAHIETIVRNLGIQTVKDFEWVFVDAFYDTNKELVAELATAQGLKAVVHVPVCAATHVGRKFHWETYNNAILLVSNPAFLRLGVYRYFHQRMVEVATDLAAKKVWVNLRQRPADAFDASLPHAVQVEKYGLEIDSRTTMNYMGSQCGMFSYSREKMLAMNGNNEALLIHHWEDCDLSNRWLQAGRQEGVLLEKAFLRVYHPKMSFPDACDPGIAAYLGKTVCRREQNPDCIYYQDDNRHLARYASNVTHWFTHMDFRWARCDACGTVAVCDEDDYFTYLRSNPYGFKAPVNVYGVGRNLTILNEDMGKLTSLQSKCELLAASHNDQRYLTPLS
jgi:hypothetical protein